MTALLLPNTLPNAAWYSPGITPGGRYLVSYLVSGILTDMKYCAWQCSKYCAKYHVDPCKERRGGILPPHCWLIPGPKAPVITLGNLLCNCQPAMREN